MRGHCTFYAHSTSLHIYRKNDVYLINYKTFQFVTTYFKSLKSLNLKRVFKASSVGATSR